MEPTDISSEKNSQLLEGTSCCLSSSEQEHEEQEVPVEDVAGGPAASTGELLNKEEDGREDGRQEGDYSQDKQTESAVASLEDGRKGEEKCSGSSSSWDSSCRGGGGEGGLILDMQRFRHGLRKYRDRGVAMMGRHQAVQPKSDNTRRGKTTWMEAVDLCVKISDEFLMEQIQQVSRQFDEVIEEVVEEVVADELCPEEETPTTSDQGRTQKSSRINIEENNGKKHDAVKEDEYEEEYEDEYEEEYIDDFEN
eukprot:GHVS01077633.1.p1 GENE.GHVS01077633.1~~GHVS01077633.1.p1  ORF type:complete len:292 (+),score=81.01 GHVS01077633.1:123-878(+)